MNCPTACGNPVWKTVQMLGRLQLTTVGVPVLLQPTNRARADVRIPRGKKNFILAD